MKYFLTNVVIAAIIAMFCSSCEMSLGKYGDPNAQNLATQQQANPTTSTQPNPTLPRTMNPSSPPVTTPTSSGQDQLNVSGAVIYRGSDPAKARVTRSLRSANKNGGSVSLSFSTLNWPSQGSTKKVDAGVYIFWRDGSRVVGGSFDWHAVGQTGKTLSNIDGGILDGHVPPSGAAIYFCMVSLDGGQRTNVKKSDTNW